jgi:hypothetical protein
MPTRTKEEDGKRIRRTFAFLSLRRREPQHVIDNVTRQAQFDS